MNVEAELLHDCDPGDPYAWQPIAILAAALGIAERSVRARVKAGTVERTKGPGGRTYYRAANGNGRMPGDRMPAGEELAQLRTELVVQQRHHATQLERLHGELREAAIVAERQRAAAMLADAAKVRALADAEAAQEAAKRAQEATAAAHAIAATLRQRARAAERLADLPWWRRRERAQLRAELAEVEPVALLAGESVSPFCI